MSEMCTRVKPFSSLGKLSSRRVTWLTIGSPNARIAPSKVRITARMYRMIVMMIFLDFKIRLIRQTSVVNNAVRMIKCPRHRNAILHFKTESFVAKKYPSGNAE